MCVFNKYICFIIVAYYCWIFLQFVFSNIYMFYHCLICLQCVFSNIYLAYRCRIHCLIFLQCVFSNVDLIYRCRIHCLIFLQCVFSSGSNTVVSRLLSEGDTPTLTLLLSPPRLRRYIVAEFHKISFCFVSLNPLEIDTSHSRTHPASSK